MIDLETVEVPEGAVILLRGFPLIGEDLGMIKPIHERFPKSLIVLISEGESFETMELDHLEQMLHDLIEHRKAQESA